jgi:hypothetical protein
LFEREFNRKLWFRGRVTIALAWLAVVLAADLSIPAWAFAWGEIAIVKAPDEIHEGDEVTIFVTATATEANVHRILAVSYPQEWKVKKSWSVIAGYDEAYSLPQSNAMAKEIGTDPGHRVTAFADTTYLSDVPGVAYFITFTTNPGSQTAATATVKAALVERIDPLSPPEMDKKTKKPKPRNTDWHLSYPERRELSLAGNLGKRLGPEIRLVRGWRTARGLVMRDSSSSATLKTDPAALQQLFAGPFTIEMWFRTSSAFQPMIRLLTDDAKTSRLLATNSLGQLYLYDYQAKTREIVAGSKAMAADGQWHHFMMTYDSTQKLRFYLDAQQLINKSVEPSHFSNITGIQLGNPRASNELQIDELRFFRRDYYSVEEFAPFIARSARDTMTGTWALFHFDEYGDQARASRPIMLRSENSARPVPTPVYFQLDTNAKLTETTSPVQTDQVLLTADMVTPTRVSINWKVSSELSVKEYALERRVGSFGEFEEVIGADAKKSIQKPRRGQSLISRASYSVTEDLPRLKGDIDLYYRVAVVTANDDIHYSEPIKLEYGDTKDVFVEQNDPNPFNPTTTLAFRLTKPAQVRLAVYDIIGREIMTITNTKLDAGRHKFVLDASNWPGGIYFYKVKTANSTITRKMVLAK